MIIWLYNNNNNNNSICQLFDFYWPDHRICHQFLPREHMRGRLVKYLTCNFNDLEPTQFKVMVPTGSPLMISCLTSIVSNIVSLRVFETFDAEVLWPRSRTVQGHPRSKVMVPIDSLCVISYSTYIDPIIASVIVFKNIWRVILMILNQDCSRSCKFKCHGDNWKPSDGFLSDIHCI